MNNFLSYFRNFQVFNNQQAYLYYNKGIIFPPEDSVVWSDLFPPYLSCNVHPNILRTGYLMLAILLDIQKELP